MAIQRITVAGRMVYFSALCTWGFHLQSPLMVQGGCWISSHHFYVPHRKKGGRKEVEGGGIRESLQKKEKKNFPEVPRNISGDNLVTWQHLATMEHRKQAFWLIYHFSWINLWICKKGREGKRMLSNRLHHGALRERGLTFLFSHL